MIHTARFKNFKCLHDVDVKLDRLTALLLKSSVIPDAIMLIRDSDGHETDRRHGL